MIYSKTPLNAIAFSALLFQPGDSPKLCARNVENVEEIVQETAASLYNDELKELTKQEENKTIDISSRDFEEEQKELSVAFVKKEFDHYN